MWENIKPDRTGDKPLYFQIKQIVAEAIENGILKPGERLPAFRKLTRDLDVSMITVKQAVGELVEEGYLYTRQGSGTYVTDGYRIKDGDICLVLPDIANPFFAQLAAGIQSAARELRRSVIYYCTEGSELRQEEALRAVIARDAGGVIIVPLFCQSLESSVSGLEHAGIPLVFADDYPDWSRVPYIAVDNELGGCLAAGHIIDKGHRRIGFVNGQPYTNTNKKRLSGFRRALAEAGLPDDGSLIQVSHLYGEAGGYDAAAKLLALAEPPTAVFAGNDLCALGVYRAAEERGLKLPGQLSVIGFDDIETAALIKPALTTVAQPIADMGRLAVEMLCGGNAAGRSHLILPPRLVVRESVDVLGSV
ncbi:MAG: GntR family transcriptional regulator [bacterium]|nr:GntR family transcriptional regulator [bacterium]